MPDGAYEPSNVIERHAPSMLQTMSLIGIEAAAHYLGVARPRLRWFCDQGYMPHLRTDAGAYMFRKTAIKDWAKRNLLTEVAGQDLPADWPVVRECTSKPAAQSPWSLQAVRPLHSFALPDSLWLHSSVVYFLVQATQVVYVGQSKNLGARVVSHMQDKAFDAVFYVCVPEDRLDKTEAAFIRALEPPLNGNGGAAITGEEIASCLAPFYQNGDS